MNPRTPKNWRRLVHGETIRSKDKIWDFGVGPWVTINPLSVGNRVCRSRSYSNYPIIRKIT